MTELAGLSGTLSDTLKTGFLSLQLKCHCYGAVNMVKGQKFVFEISDYVKHKLLQMLASHLKLLIKKIIYKNDLNKK